MLEVFMYKCGDIIQGKDTHGRVKARIEACENINGRNFYTVQWLTGPEEWRYQELVKAMIIETFYEKEAV